MTGTWQALTRVQWTTFWRGKQNVMWIVLFPLMFLVIFGFMFRGAGASTIKVVTTGEVSLLAQAVDSYIETMTVTSAEEAHNKVVNGEADAWVVAEEGMLIVRYSTADTVKAGMVQGTIGALVDRANIAATGIPPKYQMVLEPLAETSTTPLESLAPGLLGWAIVMSAAMSAAMGLVQWREAGAFGLMMAARFNPTFYLNQGLIDTIVRGAEVGEVLPPCAVMLVCAVLLYAVAFTVFRWEDRA